MMEGVAPNTAPVLETERLLLRPFRLDDVPAHHRQVGGDAVVTWDHTVHTLEQTRERIEGYLELWRRRGYGPWAVVERATGELLGHAGLQPLDDTEVVQLAYYLGRSGWGRGLATEAGARVIRFAFGELELEHLVAVVRPENEASQHVVEKLGFRYDHDGHHHDAYVQVWTLAAPGAGVSEAG